ncbi:MAG: ATP-binding protein [Chitinispirillaceae bacterium]|nr:ATP-binding protein [Chitinispirillaceae bacterium]
MNPFKYGRIVVDEDFCSRPVIEEQLTNFILSKQNVLIEGERRTGKTSLIYETVRKLKSYRYLYIDCFEIRTIEDFCRRTVNAMISMEKRAGFIESLVKSLAHLRPKMTIDPLTGEPSIGLDAVTGARPDSIEGLMDVIADEYGKRKIVVVFDEFQDILHLKDAQAILAVFRGKIQFHTSIPYVFSGSIRGSMHEIFYDPASPFFKSAASMTVSNLERERFGEFIIAKFLHNGGRRIQKELLTAVFEIAQDTPGDVQELCAAIWDSTSSRQSITTDIIPAALDLIFSREQRVYENYLGLLTGQQLRCLVSLARLNGKAPFSAEFIQDSGIRQPGSIQKALERLIGLRIIYLVNREYKYVNPFFRAWLLGKGY